MRKQFAAATLLVALIAAGCAQSGAVASQNTTAAGGTAQTAPGTAQTPAGESKENLNDQAFAQIQAKNWAEAIRLASRAVALDPGYAPAQFNLGLAYYRAGQYAEAKPHLEAAYQQNKAQVEPGWFYALTLEQLKQAAEAVTVLKELQVRFPDDADVKAALVRLGAGDGQAATAATGDGAVVWKRPGAGIPSVYLGDRLVQATADRKGIEAVGPDGKVAWTLPLSDQVSDIRPDGSGTRVVVTLEHSDQLVDAVAGKVLSTAPFKSAADSKGGRMNWKGDLLLYGAANWLGDRYSHTNWTLYQIGSDGAFAARYTLSGEFAELSADGRAILFAPYVGAAADLYVDGRLVRTTAPSTRFTSRGDLLWTATPAEIQVTGLDGAKVLTRPRPALPGAATLVPWYRGDGQVWFLDTSAAGRYNILKGETGTVEGSGTFIAQSPGYLLVKADAVLEAVDENGKVVTAFPPGAGWFSPDGRWVFRQTLEEIRAWRLP